MSKAEVEVYALSEMNTACRELGDVIQRVLDSMEQELGQEAQRLELVRSECVREVEHCEAAYESCRSYVDEDGNPPPCTVELRALQEAQRALQQVEDQINHFASQADAFRRQASALRNEAQESIVKARRDLNEHIDTLLYYLRSHPEEIEGIGGDHHGSRYRNARHELIIRTARGEFDNHTMNVIQPQLINQVENHSGYFRSPVGYHASHMVRGIHIPENLTWEQRAVNQGRYWEARRLGLTRDTAYG